MTDIALDDLTRPIVGIENRTAQEVFDIMCDRFRRASSSQVAPANPAQVMEAMMPAYGTVDFLELGKDVNEATTGQRLDFDFGDGYPGHAMLPALNFNSLSRIVSKYITAAIGTGGQAVAWQWRQRAIYKTSGRKGEWSDWSEGRAPFLRVANYEAEERPLYTHPPHPADERAVEALTKATGVIDTLIESLSEGLMTDAGLSKADRVGMKHQISALELAKDGIAALSAKEGR